MSRRTASRTPKSGANPPKNGARPARSGDSPAKSKLGRSATVKTPAKTRPRQPEPAGAPPVGRRSFARSAQDARIRAARRRAARNRQPWWMEVRDGLRGVPRAAWICAVVAIVNAVCWSVISPPFEIPDEPSHFAYVQRLAETGQLPTLSNEKFPPSEYTVLNDLHYTQVRFHPERGTMSTEAEQRKLEADLAKPLERSGTEGAAGVAASEPPLYYALETIPYALASSGSTLDQAATMRLFSALLSGLTALFAFLFLREALPGARWAWTVGGLGVALMPLLGMMSGAVNPDALLFAVSTALFYCLARGFRRGITPWLAAALGAVLAIGLTAKLSFLGLVPGAVLGLLALCIAAARKSRQNALRCLALGAGIGASPVILYGLINLLSGRPIAGSFAAAITFGSKGGSLLKEIGYIWQFYLPRLPGMSHNFRGLSTTRVLWFDGLVGLYGWLDTTFPNWVYNFALVPTGLILALFGRALFVYRAALRSRAVEIGVYLAIGLGVLGLVGADDYLHKIPGEYAEPRYALPMLALWGAVLALAARGAGRRWGPVAGALIVCVVLAHNIFSQLLVISRYYG
jgi:hypothetical protein